MKKLTVYLRPTSEALKNFKEALKLARQGKLKGTHYEIGFDTKRSFDRFAKNIGVLSVIRTRKPKSVYELAKILKMDVSNLNKLISFFEMMGVVSIKISTVNGRTVRTPIVEYDQIEFDLRAAS